MTAAHDRPEDPWPHRNLTYEQACLAELIAAYARAHLPGRYLLSAPQLARRFRTNVTDAEAALRYLVDNQLLDTRRKGNIRKGDSHIHMRANGEGVRLEQRPVDGELDCAAYRRARETVVAWIAHALGVPPRTTMTVVHRLLTFDGRPAAHTATVLHPATDPILPRGTWRTRTAADILGSHGLVVRTAAISAQIRPATNEGAHALGLETGQPAIDYRELLELASGPQPMAVTTAWLHPAYYRVTLSQDHVLRSPG